MAQPSRFFPIKQYLISPKTFHKQKSRGKKTLKTWIISFIPNLLLLLLLPPLKQQRKEERIFEGKLSRHDMQQEKSRVEWGEREKRNFRLPWSNVHRLGCIHNEDNLISTKAHAGGTDNLLELYRLFRRLSARGSWSILRRLGAGRARLVCWRKEFSKHKGKWISFS